MQARGRKAQLVLAFESVYGETPESPAGKKMPIVSSGVRSSQTLNEDQTIRNNRNPAMPTRGNIDVSGSISVPVDTIAIGYWLKAMFGAPETTGTDLFTHTFTPGGSQPSLVLEQGFTDIEAYSLFNGCKISSFTLPIGGEGDVTATLEVMGASETVEATPLVSTPEEISLTKFNQFQASIKEGGAEIAIVTEGDLRIDFSLDGESYPVGAQGTRSDLPEGIMQVTGRIRAFFEDTSLLSKAMSGVESSLEFKWANGANSLEFVIPELIYERNSPVIEGPRGVYIELPYRGYFEDNPDGAAVKAVLTNAQAIY